MNIMVSCMLGLQPHEQVEHLRLDRDVERRDRLVGDDQLGAEGERAGDADPLTLAAAQGRGPARGELRRQADRGHQRGDAIGPLGRRADLVHAQRLGQGLAPRSAWD